MRKDKTFSIKDGPIRFAPLLLLLCCVVCSAFAGDTTPNQLTTQQQKIYLFGDSTWAPKFVPTDTSGTAIGVATAAKQPALGTAGTPSADVLSVQGLASGYPLAVSGQYNTSLPTLTTGQTSVLQLTSKGAAAITVYSAAGNAVDANTPTDGQSNSKTSLFVNALPSYFDGSTWQRQRMPTAVARLVTSAASTNATSVKASSADVFSLVCMNTTASVKWLKIYNKASAPTVGTDTPFASYPLPPSNTLFRVDFATPIYLSTGFAYALTGAGADNDTTALSSGDVVGCNFAYQ